MLDPPVTTALVASTLYAFGFDLMVQGYGGASVRLKELTGNTQKDFSPDPTTGAFPIASVTAWAGSADVDLVQFYDQNGSGLNLTPTGNAAVRRSSVYNQFGTTFNSATAQLTRAQTGGLAVNLAGAGHLTLTGTTINVPTNGFEIHLLWSSNTRKIGTTDTTDPLGGNTTLEWLFGYGSTSNARLFYQSGGGVGAMSARLQTSSTDLTNYTPNISTAGVNRTKQYSQYTMTMAFPTSPTVVNGYGFGRQYSNQAATANMQTAIAGGTLNNGTLLIGSNFASTSNNSALTTNRLNGFVGGVILTNALGDKDRSLIQAKLALIGQQHRAQTTATILSYMEEWFIAKNVDGSGNVAGVNGNTTLAFNQGGAGTDWNFAYAPPGVGIQGIRAGSATYNNNDTFVATNSYFAGVTTGTVIALHLSEQSANSLSYSIARESQSVWQTLLNVNVTSGTYVSATGVLTLVVPAITTAGISSGAFCAISGLAGTGAVASLNSSWAYITSGSTSTSLKFQATIGLGTIAITGGTGNVKAVPGLSARGNLGLGLDHTSPGFITQWGLAKDIENLFVGRYKVYPNNAPVASATYNSGTGVLNLVFASPLGAVLGSSSYFTVSGLAGTGAVASLNAVWPTAAGSTQTSINLQCTAGLGAITITPATGLFNGYKAWGAAIYETDGGGVNQSMGKYNVNTTNDVFVPTMFAAAEVVTDPDIGAIAGSISSATYVSLTGVLTLNLSVAVTQLLPDGTNLVVAGITGGAVNGTWPFIAAGSTTTALNFQITTGLGALTLVTTLGTIGITTNTALWTNTDSYYLLDAPVNPPPPENLTSLFRYGALLMQIATFQAPNGYDPNASYVTRRAQRLTGTSSSQLGAWSCPLNHFDGSYAINVNAGVADGNADDRLMSQQWQNAFWGTRVLYATLPATLTLAQQEAIAMNVYKLVS